MTTIGLKGLFDFAKGENGYSSREFNNFLASRKSIQRHQKSTIIGKTIPSGGDFKNSPLAGYKATETNTQLEENSSAVLIPAFIQSYTMVGKEYNPIPRILSMLPNWSISYTGLNKIDWVKNHFRSITLRHAYTGTYRIDNYNSFIAWQGNDTNKLGFIPNQDGNTSKVIASIAYDISSVSMQESFAPLMGIDITMNNGISTNLNWRKNRGVVLNLSAFQLIESSSDELTIGLNYKIADLSTLWRSKPTRRTRKNKNAKVESPKGLTIRMNYTYKRSLALIRKIQENYTQATQGNIDNIINISADYDLSRMITLKAFYQWNENNPLISTSGFPMSNNNFGVSLRINLMQ